MINSLMTTKFSSAKFQKNLHLSHIILRIQRIGGKSVDLEKVAHYEPPHQDLHRLQIYLFSSVALKELKTVTVTT